MRTVSLYFTLVGKTDWRRRFNKNQQVEWTNETTFDKLQETIKNQFGDRPVFVNNENRLKNNSCHYPKFFSAGWIISKEDLTELVIVGHGESMESANRAMLDSVKGVDWNKYSKKIVT